MGELKVKDKDIVVPGEVLAEGMDYLPTGGAFREGEQIIASQLGLININNRLIKLIPLSGRYYPKVGDNVIGKVVDIAMSGWIIDIGCSNNAMIPLKDGSSSYIERGADLRQYYDFDDYVLAKVSQFTGKNIDLTMKDPSLRKLSAGKIIKVASSKVPRVIGKQGSMINMIKEMTNTKISVGQNGLIWISGENASDERKAENAIKLIEDKSHIEGLTEEIKKFLESK